MEIEFTLKTIWTSFFYYLCSIVSQYQVTKRHVGIHRFRIDFGYFLSVALFAKFFLRNHSFFGSDYLDLHSLWELNNRFVYNRNLWRALSCKTCHLTRWNFSQTRSNTHWNALVSSAWRSIKIESGQLEMSFGVKNFKSWDSIIFSWPNLIEFHLYTRFNWVLRYSQLLVWWIIESISKILALAK